MIKINIHSSLARFTNNQTELKLPIDNTSNILAVLGQHYEKLHANILDEQGSLSPYVNIYVNGTSVRQIPNTSITAKDTIDIVTALVGG
jgi:molybdopterin converting factor small subunit